MISKKYNQQIDNIIQEYFENSKNIQVFTKSLDPNRSLYELTNKLATKFCLKNNILSANEVSVEILNIFGRKIEDMSKKLYITDDFRFETVILY